MNQSGPMATYRYRLEFEDCLAYERLPGELGGWSKFWLLLSFASVGGFYAAVEEWPFWWRWGASGLYGLALLVAVVAVLTLRGRRRARRLAETHRDTDIEDWGDRLAIRSAAGQQFVAMETIGKVISGDSHVFILYEGGPIILPLRAFEDKADMDAFAAALDQRSEDAVP